MPPHLLSFLPARLIPDNVDTATVPMVIHTHFGAASAIHVIARIDGTVTLSATDCETLITAAEDIGTLRAAEAREAKTDKDAAGRQPVRRVRHAASRGRTPHQDLAGTPRPDISGARRQSRGVPQLSHRDRGAEEARLRPGVPVSRRGARDGGRRPAVRRMTVAGEAVPTLLAARSVHFGPPAQARLDADRATAV